MIRARIRVTPEDFEVEELMGFEPDGQGEHLLLWIEKRGINTAWLGTQLAAWANVPASSVSWSGMKDRHAVTRQWFSIHLPRRIAPERDPELDGIQVLARSWHGRKLRRGSHRGNRFVITLRDVQGDRDTAEAALEAVARRGVPNAFGEQRFGREAGNLARARSWLSAERPRRLPHEQRGLMLSAARSHLFNLVLAERVRRDDWDRGIPGDCFQLEGSGSWFGPEADIGEELCGRVDSGDIHPTGPLWGAGDSPAAGEAADIETAVLADEKVLREGLARFDLRQERRALRVRPKDFCWEWLGDDALRLRFQLPRGCFATAVLAAFCDTVDASQATGGAVEPGP